MSGDLLVGVDGGNSKTELALVTETGQLLAVVRAPGASPHAVGVEGTVELIGRMVSAAFVAAGIHEVAVDAALFLAGVDTDEEEVQMTAALAATGRYGQLDVHNDTFAVLLAGTMDGVGGAVVCGAGINATVVAPDGRVGRYPSLGPISGDFGGGMELGQLALTLAVRGSDGRGQPTRLSTAVPAHFGLTESVDVGIGLFYGQIPSGRLTELVPIIFDLALSGDAVAQSIVDRQAAELVAMPAALIERMQLADSDIDIAYGGGLIRAGHGPMMAKVRAGLAERLPRARVVEVVSPPVVGACRFLLRRHGGQGMGEDLDAALTAATPVMID